MKKSSRDKDKELIAYVTARGSATTFRILADLGINKRSTKIRLQRLIRKGYLDTRQDNHGVYYSIPSLPRKLQLEAIRARPRTTSGKKIIPRGCAGGQVVERTWQTGQEMAQIESARSQRLAAAKGQAQKKEKEEP